MDSFPSSDPVRTVTQAEISSFALDGVVHLPEIVHKDWVDLLDSALKLMLKEPRMFVDLTALGSDLNVTQGLSVLTDSGIKGGRFLSGVDHWKEDEIFAAFAKITHTPRLGRYFIN